MRLLRVEYHKEKCIGSFNCTKTAPEFFKEAGPKANLAGAKTKSGYQTREVECDEKTASQLIEAAEKCPANVITVIDSTTKEKIVDTRVRTTNHYREIEAYYDDAKEFVIDEKGYFLIRTIPEKKLIEVGFCRKRNQVEVKVYGKTPTEIYQTILREKIIKRADHAAYLGKELQKAYASIQLGIPYVQDDELDFKQVRKENS